MQKEKEKEGNRGADIGFYSEMYYNIFLNQCRRAMQNKAAARL